MMEASPTLKVSMSAVARCDHIHPQTCMTQCTTHTHVSHPNTHVSHTKRAGVRADVTHKGAHIRRCHIHTDTRTDTSYIYTCMYQRCPMSVIHTLEDLYECRPPILPSIHPSIHPPVHPSIRLTWSGLSMSPTFFPLPASLASRDVVVVAVVPLLTPFPLLLLRLLQDGESRSDASSSCGDDGDVCGLG